MVKGRKKKSTPFSKLANHRKKEYYISLKNDIRKDYLIHEFYFYTMDYLGEDTKATWADVCFLSKKYKNIFYNCTIDIAQNKLISDAEDATWPEYEDAYLEHPEQLDLKFTPTSYKNGKPSLYKMDTSVWDIKYDDMNGMTCHDYANNPIDKYLQENKPPVYEEYILHDDFDFGIGLDIIVDADYITYKRVNDYIHQFYERDEVAWKAENPVNPDKLHKHNWYEDKQVPLSNVVNI